MATILIYDNPNRFYVPYGKGEMLVLNPGKNVLSEKDGKAWEGIKKAKIRVVEHRLASGKISEVTARDGSSTKGLSPSEAEKVVGNTFEMKDLEKYLAENKDDKAMTALIKRQMKKVQEYDEKLKGDAK
jgi:hypothetical protein